MGMQTAQAAQPISQQQPGQSQGKGGLAHPLNNTAYQQINPQLQQTGYGPTVGDAGIFGQTGQPQGQPATLNVPTTQPYRPDVMGQGGEDSFQNMTAPAGGQNGQANSPIGYQQQGQFQGKGGTTNAATSGQPQMGRPNKYPNTIQPWDNANIQPRTQSGKGKGY